tara:strand:+ start:1750 stop:2361 length:612 start_codon:yes stop_codon:yes gene_type:complete
MTEWSGSKAFGGKKTKGQIYKIDSSGKVLTSIPITFGLNPTIIRRARSVNYKMHNPPGGYGSLAEFVNVGDEILSFDVYLSSKRVVSSQNKALKELYRQFGVMHELKQFEALTLPVADAFLKANGLYIPPPGIIFEYGKRAWKCKVQKLNIIEEEHNAELYPTRAKVSMTLITYIDSFSDITASVVNADNWSSFSEVPSGGSG